MNPLAALRPATTPGHIGFRARFVEEDQPRRVETGLLPPPGPPGPLVVNDNYSSLQCQLEITSLPAWFVVDRSTLWAMPCGGTESLEP